MIINCANLINGHCDNLENHADDLIGYANSFASIGNLEFSKKLRNIAFKIQLAQTEIRKEMYLELNRQFEQANQSSLNVLNAALAGITISKG